MFCGSHPYISSEECAHDRRDPIPDKRNSIRDRQPTDTCSGVGPASCLLPTAYWGGVVGGLCILQIKNGVAIGQSPLKNKFPLFHIISLHIAQIHIELAYCVGLHRFIACGVHHPDPVEVIGDRVAGGSHIEIGGVRCVGQGVA